MNRIPLITLMFCLTGPIFADTQDALAPTGDAIAGAKAFKRQCTACHIVGDEAGNILAGRRGRTGPNLYDIIGKPAGSVEGFRYSRALTAAGDADLIWNNDTFSAYIQDPTGYLREILDNPRARAKMSFRVRKDQDARDIYAFLRTLSPE